MNAKQMVEAREREGREEKREQKAMNATQSKADWLRAEFRAIRHAANHVQAYELEAMVDELLAGATLNELYALCQSEGIAAVRGQTPAEAIISRLGIQWL